MNIYLYQFDDRVELVFARSIKLNPEIRNVIELGKLSVQVPECRFVVGPYDGSVFDYRVLWQLLRNKDGVAFDELHILNWQITAQMEYGR